MKLLFILPTICGGGAERVATMIANILVEKHMVNILCIESGSVNDYRIKDNVRVIEAGYIPKRGHKARAVFSFISNFWSMYKFTVGYFNEYSPDIIISFLPKTDFISYLIKKSRRCVWISSERNDPWQRSRIERSILNYIYKKTDCLVCQTKIVKDYYENCGVKTTTVIANPITDPPIVTKGKIRSRYGKFAVAIGRLDPQKNYRLLIEAYIYANKQVNKDYKLLIVGEGPSYMDLKEVILDRGVENKVILEGRKSNIYDYLADADFFVMSSNYEGMPNALLEAMSMELPVICTDVKTGVAHELIDDTNGFVVPVGDREALSYAIIQMMEMNEKERQNMGKVSAQKVKHMRADIIVNEWEKLLDGMAKA